jgi:CDP-glycerol glycerophosphotransferase (TagB/SpsB family)
MNREPDKEWIRGFAPVFADFIAVWGDSYKKSLVECGVPAKKIVVTGSPRFDGLAKKKFDLDKIRKKLGISRNDKIFVFAPPVLFNIGELEIMAREIRKIPGCRLVVKLHPTIKTEDYTIAAGKDAVIVQHVDLYELIAVSAALITDSSTTGLEAMAMGKPVIIFGRRLMPGNIYASTMAVLRARNAPELHSALKSILKNGSRMARLRKNMRRFVFENAFRQDGLACERICRVVENIANGKWVVE